jgi:hypothetical protein
VLAAYGIQLRLGRRVRRNQGAFLENGHCAPHSDFAPRRL